MQWPCARKISVQLVLCRQAEIQKFLQVLKKANIRIYSFKGSPQKDLRFEPLSHLTNLEKFSVLINDKYNFL